MGGVEALSDAGVRRLVQRTCASSTGEPFGAYLFGSEEPAAELGRHLERTVFLEAFGNTPSLLAAEYGPYERHSVFICVVDHLRKTPAGVMRVILPSAAGLKSVNDLEAVWGEAAAVAGARTGITIDLAKTWDIATLAVAPEYRGNAVRGLVSMGLYQSLTLSARACATEWFVAILDMSVFRLIRWKLHMIFAGYKGVGPLPYLGSPASIPSWCNVEAAERHLAASDPDLHAVLVRGVGLESALRPLDLSATLRLIASLGGSAGRAVAG